MPNEPPDPKTMSRRDVLRTFALGGAAMLMPNLAWLPALQAPVAQSRSFSRLLPPDAFTVLVTDDCIEVLRLTEMILTRAAGFNVIATLSSDRVLAICRRQAISLVISDISRPDMNGLDLLAALRADRAIKHIPFMFTSARLCSFEVRERARALGVDAQLAKPFLPKELLREIVRLLPVDPQSFHPRFRSMMSEV